MAILAVMPKTKISKPIANDPAFPGTRYWLKAYGSSAAPLADDWRGVGAGLLKTCATFARRPTIASGDRIVYYAAGGSVFAAGEIDGQPYEAAVHGYASAGAPSAFPWMLDVTLTTAVELVHCGVPLGALNTPGSKNDIRVRIRRRSHVQISAAEYARALELLGVASSKKKIAA